MHHTFQTGWCFDEALAKLSGIDYELAGVACPPRLATVDAHAATS